MELQIIIKSGEREGHSFSLQHVSGDAQSIPWVKENEAIEFRLVASDRYATAVLEHYEHCIETTRVEAGVNDGEVVFIWTPKFSRNYRYECLFINYFGLAELNVLLTGQDGLEASLESFQPLEVLASKLTGDRVEEMFDYLASLSDDVLHSVFSATKHGVDFDEGSVSPSFTQERLEHAASNLQQKIPLILQHPITRLVPEHKIVPTDGMEDIDEGALGWLLENLSVLSETDNIDDSHVAYEGDFYKADSLQMAVLEDNSDLYENHVLHGYVELLLHEAQSLIARYSAGFGVKRWDGLNKPTGYTSFFDKVARFKKQLMAGQLSKCEALVVSLKQMKVCLEKNLPVRRSIMDRPIITPKARVNHVYRSIFIDVISWHERGKIDWTAHENLFAIQSIPSLFEAYCYFRTTSTINEIFSTNQTEDAKELETLFIDEQGAEVWLRREPSYWVAGHKNTFGETFVNSEGWTVRDNTYLNRRSQKGPWAQRKPDITIEISMPNGIAKMLVMDAKYTSVSKAFIDYLPELTMKYVHGIHRGSDGNAIVGSLTILHPEENGLFRSYHREPYGVFDEYPVSPSLQCLGVKVGKDRETDKLQELLRQSLKQMGVLLPDVERKQNSLSERA